MQLPNLVNAFTFAPSVIVFFIFCKLCISYLNLTLNIVIRASSDKLYSQYSSKSCAFTYTNPEYCHLEYQDGKIIIIMDPSKIEILQLDSLYSFDKRSKIQEKIFSFDVGGPPNYHNSHISVDKTSITILHFPHVHQILSKKNEFPLQPMPIVSKRFNFWI